MRGLDDQIARLEAILAQKRAQGRKQSRRDDARQKIIMGAAVMGLLDAMPEERRARLLRDLHARITRASDRAFMGLPVAEPRAASKPPRASKDESMAPRPKPEPPSPSAPPTTAPGDVKAAPCVMPRLEPDEEVWGELPFPV